MASSRPLHSENHLKKKLRASLNMKLKQNSREPEKNYLNFKNVEKVSSILREKACGIQDLSNLNNGIEKKSTKMVTSELNCIPKKQSSEKEYCLRSKKRSLFKSNNSFSKNTCLLKLNMETESACIVSGSSQMKRVCKNKADSCSKNGKNYSKNSHKIFQKKISSIEEVKQSEQFSLLNPIHATFDDISINRNFPKNSIFIPKTVEKINISCSLLTLKNDSSKNYKKATEKVQFKKKIPCKVKNEKLSVSVQDYNVMQKHSKFSSQISKRLKGITEGQKINDTILKSIGCKVDSNKPTEDLNVSEINLKKELDSSNRNQNCQLKIFKISKNKNTCSNIPKTEFKKMSEISPALKDFSFSFCKNKLKLLLNETDLNLSRSNIDYMTAETLNNNSCFHDYRDSITISQIDFLREISKSSEICNKIADETVFDYGNTFSTSIKQNLLNLIKPLNSSLFFNKNHNFSSYSDSYYFVSSAVKNNSLETQPPISSLILNKKNSAPHFLKPSFERLGETRSSKILNSNYNNIKSIKECGELKLVNNLLARQSFEPVFDHRKIKSQGDFEINESFSKLVTGKKHLTPSSSKAFDGSENVDILLENTKSLERTRVSFDKRKLKRESRCTAETLPSELGGPSPLKKPYKPVIDLDPKMYCIIEKKNKFVFNCNFCKDVFETKTSFLVHLDNQGLCQHERISKIRQILLSKCAGILLGTLQSSTV